MGWGVGLGSFFEGYQKTLGQRHAQREQQFNNLMGLAQKYSEIADQQRKKAVWDERTEFVIKDAEESAKKYALDAEKTLNQPIGGLSKLSGLFKRIMANKQQTQEEGSSPEPGQESSPAPKSAPAPTPEQSAPPAEGPPPAFSSGFTPQQQQWIGLPPPPDTPAPTAAAPPVPAQAPNLSLSGLRPGQFLNPEIGARQQIELDAAIAKARATGQISLEQELEKSKKVFEQTSLLKDQEFEKSVPALKASGVSDKEIERVRLAYKTGMANIFKTQQNKPIIDRQRPFQGPDNKWYSNTYIFDEETGQYTMGQPVETGPPAAVTNLSSKMQEKINNYKASHPNVTSDEEAEQAVRKMDNSLVENKLRSSNWKAVSDQALAVYRGDRTRYYKEAQEAKQKGKGMTPALANSVLVHADSMAKVDLGDDTFDDPEEKRMALLNESNAWLINNVGLSRQDLMEIIKGKGLAQGDKDTKIKDAKASLLAPPASKSSGSGKKSGDYNP